MENVAQSHDLMVELGVVGVWGPPTAEASEFQSIVEAIR